ncbi:hypothetical protein JWG42_10055 [Desulfoprunum benzoelyticum]|uniref:Uncharacterized protein n=1 Tax=Desulfoprunum benzoelyticum TaxID=1506996 RepID=A0A840UN30_9BACT|nr:hypothetical protein [Desulfoprunum benzoelyticum]MBB5347182.1 hypothetical protein [Desulfoprunum benzoelyticum]MBM9530492.1 hypothetical protein [Desulfoprunum benzoelyticum]
MKKSDNDAKEAAIATIMKAADKWPTSFVPRSRVPEFTGGLIAVGTMANRDSAGTGPEGAFKIGRQQCYSVEGLLRWLIERMEA